MILKLKLIFKFIFFVLKNEVIPRDNFKKSFIKFNLNSKTYIVETVGSIKVENPLEDLKIKGWIIQYELMPDVWSDRIEKKFYRSYESASEAIINIKQTDQRRWRVKPIYVLDKSQMREVEIKTILDI